MAYLSLIIFLCSMGAAFANDAASTVQVKTEDVVSINKDGVQRVMLNIYPYLTEIGKGAPTVKQKVLLELVNRFINDSYAKDQNIKEVDLQVVIIKNMDEYARPDFSDMSRVAKINYLRKIDKTFGQNILEMNIDLLKS